MSKEEGKNNYPTLVDIHRLWYVLTLQTDQIEITFRPELCLVGVVGKEHFLTLHFRYS